MSEFTSPLVVEHISEREWIVRESFEYHVGSYPSDQIITVPKGFDTDFASIPRIFWGILPPSGPYGKAAVVHDYCYRTACYSRKISDIIFLEGMDVLKVSGWKKIVIYYAVRWFGWHAWNKRRIERESKTHDGDAK